MTIARLPVRSMPAMTSAAVDRAPKGVVIRLLLMGLALLVGGWCGSADRSPAEGAQRGGGTLHW